MGYDIRSQADLIRSKIGYMPEYNALDPGLFAVDQVRYAGELLGMNTKVATQRAHEVLEYVGLEYLANSRIVLSLDPDYASKPPDGESSGV